jgi:FeS assembly SUF system regulator
MDRNDGLVENGGNSRPCFEGFAMLRVGKLTDYALVIVAEMARAEAILQASSLADATQLPLPTVRKILKTLTKGGLCCSVRGTGGGYRLAKPPQSISLAEVVTLIEGPIALSECQGSPGCCARESFCNLRPHWGGISHALRQPLPAVPIRRLLPEPSPREPDSAALAERDERTRATQEASPVPVALVRGTLARPAA